MKNSIAEIVEKFQSQIEEIVASGERISISEAEERFRKPMQEFLRKIMQAYYEEIDEALRLDKAGRKVAGLIVERRDDKRSVLTDFGELEFSRTYYINEQEQRYEYPVDQVAGLEGYERISGTIGIELAAAACTTSYANSSSFVTGGNVSRQTVMHKIRECEPQQEQRERRKVPFLHVDADEDHVTLTGGKNTIIPLISVYEGIDRQGERGVCRNVFHISEYGMETDKLWEQVLDRIEERYDLSDTKIYLHGDGARWVRKGLEWLPNAHFVLDKYHRNKAIKEITAGADSCLRANYAKTIKQALLKSDCVAVAETADKCIEQSPDRADKIREAAGYLIDFQDAIAITATDPEANNGGCTEPHVSHVLSRRLSSRPMAWSKLTLRALAPILASNRSLRIVRKKQPDPLPLLTAAAQAAGKAISTARTNRNTAGLVDPDTAVNLTLLQNGKVTPLFKTLHSISQS